MAIFFNYTKSDQPSLSNKSLVVQQFDQADRQPESSQPSVNVAKRDVDVRQAESESDRLIPDLGNPGKLRHKERLHLVAHERKLRYGERHKAPVLFPCLIKNMTRTHA